jgi:DNA-binding HxlR family transcriptional regulator
MPTRNNQYEHHGGSDEQNCVSTGRISRAKVGMLTQTLRNLEKDGLVTRKVYATVPPKAEYSLTQLGESVYKPLDEICRWTEDHLEELKKIWAIQALKDDE